MVIDPRRREMFTDLYRLAEYYEAPPFQPGDIDWNADWFVMAQEKALIPFLSKYSDDAMAGQLAIDIVSAADRLARIANETQSVL